MTSSMTPVKYKVTSVMMSRGVMLDVRQRQISDNSKK